MKKRWPTTLIAYFLLFSMNWALWAYEVVVRKQWRLTPIESTLSRLQESGEMWLLYAAALMLAAFLIILTLRIYLYLLLLEYDETFRKELFAPGPHWRLTLEFWLRCLAVVAVNFIYYAASHRMGTFHGAIVVTSLAVWLWDLLMLNRLDKITSLRGVHVRDGWLLLCALMYYFSVNDGSGSGLQLILFGITTAVGVTIFVSEMSSTYLDVVRRVVREREFGVSV